MGPVVSHQLLARSLLGHAVYGFVGVKFQKSKRIWDVKLRVFTPHMHLFRFCRVDTFSSRDSTEKRIPT
jgi:hypothetical protein